MKYKVTSVSTVTYTVSESDYKFEIFYLPNDEKLQRIQEIEEEQKKEIEYSEGSIKLTVEPITET